MQNLANVLSSKDLVSFISLFFDLFVCNIIFSFCQNSKPAGFIYNIQCVLSSVFISNLDLFTNLIIYLVIIVSVVIDFPVVCIVYSVDKNWRSWEFDWERAKGDSYNFQLCKYWRHGGFFRTMQYIMIFQFVIVWHSKTYYHCLFFLGGGGSKISILVDDTYWISSIAIWFLFCQKSYWMRILTFLIKLQQH